MIKEELLELMEDYKYNKIHQERCSKIVLELKKKYNLTNIEMAEYFGGWEKQLMKKVKNLTKWKSVEIDFIYRNIKPLI